MITGGDVDRALDMFSALGLGQSDSMAMVTIAGAPWSKSRPRFSRTGRTYSDPADRDAEQRTGAFLRAAVHTPWTGNVGMACLFYRPNRQRIDVDNLLKHVCDSGNGILWADDSQCTALLGVLELDAERPRTVIAVGEHVSTLTRGSSDVAICKVCLGLMPLTGVRRTKKTCSPECASIVRGYIPLTELFPCVKCNKRFRRRTTAQHFCSEACKQDASKGQRVDLGPLSKCVDCGAQLKHRRGGRCRDCWKTWMKDRSQ